MGGQVEGGWGGGRVDVRGVGEMGGCEQRIEVFVKIQTRVPMVL